MAQKPTIALIGPGAIGTTIAAALHEVGHTPIICGRSPRENLELKYEAQKMVVPGPVKTDPNDITHPVDLVFVAVKTTQVAAAAPWLKALCNNNTVVCALQNGVEQKASLSPLTSGATVLPSVVWFPAQRQSDDSVWLRKKARLTLPDTPQTAIISNALQGSLCHVDIATDFTSTAWHKLLRNAVAGLMVLTTRRAGMFARDDITKLAYAYLDECLQVARAEGAQLGDDVRDEIIGVLQGYAPDMSTSILVDRLANQPMEWDIRNGIFKRLGQAHHLETPISDIIVPLLAAASDGPG
ncbi:oxidoreductase [Celerinatantimonas diazotrophica]|uniref:2-dehydropantoate 2-reductase n=1 Tax=Celerinatantimonas diazotrophica TaxID=412034 RepID=A0A4R1K5G7_9GAMM|nr:oxidoreductase [Celerinatantimonas diazotrophica]TCK58993.1 ketopantoate reductase [Celerinatantimonas diazotrophica]CAG9297628.1 2-dehydropantoate 2-reductase [Celerinatantimonas diazotrophica]